MEFRTEHRTRADLLKVFGNLQICFCYVFISRNFVAVMLT